MFSASELLQAITVIHDRDWHPRAGQTSFGYYLDAASSRVEITFDQRDSDVAEALRARLGDRVHIKWGTPSRL